MPESPTEERWTIEVCASCGAGPEEGDCSMECTDAKLVEVVPASQVEALQAEVERLREALERIALHATGTTEAHHFARAALSPQPEEQG